MTLNTQHKSPKSSPQPLITPIAKNECWTLTFVTCELFGGHPIRALTVIDEFTRECPVIGINFQYPSWQVVKTLGATVAACGKPQRLRLANERAFKAPDLDLWAFTENIELEFISALHPEDSAVIQTLNETFRRLCLDKNWFASLDDARRKTDSWRQEYNGRMPHADLRGLSPATFAERHISSGASTTARRDRKNTNQRPTPLGWKPITES